MARSIAFIDPRVTGYLELARTFDAGVEVVFLDPNADGVQQIADWLAGQSGINAVHIVSHGAEATIQLGSAELSASTLSTYAHLLEKIGYALSKEADILLYGCEVASGPGGQAFIEQLAMLTGADVAASNDTTGASQFGGDASLEVHFGDISSELILDQSEFDRLNSLLATLPASIAAGTGSWIWTNPFGDFPTSSFSIGSTTEIDYYRFQADVTGTFTISVSGGTLDSKLRV